MDQHKPELVLDNGAADTPEDVAILYAWANLQGAKYRDFSGSRREYRAQVRCQQTGARREAAAQALATARTATAAVERAAREAEEAARFHEAAALQALGLRRDEDAKVEETARQRALRSANELAKRAAAERVEAARCAETLAAVEATARRAERELEEARASAQRQANQYHQAEARRRELAGPQPAPDAGGRMHDPYTLREIGGVRPDRILHEPLVPEEDMQPMRFRQTRDLRILPQPGPGPEEFYRDPPEYGVADTLNEGEEIMAPGAAGRQAAEQREPVRRESSADTLPGSELLKEFDSGSTAEYRRAKAEAVEAERRLDAAAKQPQRRSSHGRPSGSPDAAENSAKDTSDTSDTPGVPELPAWLAEPARMLGSRGGSRAKPVPPVAGETLVQSRERFAAQWYALKGVFKNNQPEHVTEPPAAGRREEAQVPMLTVFSLAGGVGKTCLVATLGRALASTGERVLLADRTAGRLLPFYFGASELRTGAVRTFSSSEESGGTPVYLVSFDAPHGGRPGQDTFWEDLRRASRGMDRVIVDVGSQMGSTVVQRLARTGSQVLVPLAPDMNSVFSLRRVEETFAGLTGAEGGAPRPTYLLNQFDVGLPLHLDVREVLRQRLGDRLLPFVVRRSPAVGEALAEGMTVLDYAPEAAVCADFANLANWLRETSAAAEWGSRASRRSGR